MNLLPDWDIVRTKFPNATSITTRSHGAPDDDPRNVHITLAFSLFTFKRTRTAGMVIAAACWRLFQQGFIMSDSGLWGCLQDANHQTLNEVGTTLEQSLDCLSTWVNPPKLVRTFLHNQGRLSADMLIEQPDLQRGEFLIVVDQHCEDATFGLIPLCSTRTWILYEPCAVSGARWMAFHQWHTCLAQIRAGLNEAGSTGYLAFSVLTTGEPKFP